MVERSCLNVLFINFCLIIFIFSYGNRLSSNCFLNLGEFAAVLLPFLFLKWITMHGSLAFILQGVPRIFPLRFRNGIGSTEDKNFPVTRFGFIFYLFIVLGRGRDENIFSPTKEEIPEYASIYHIINWKNIGQSVHLKVSFETLISNNLVRFWCSAAQVGLQIRHNMFIFEGEK